MLIKFFKEEEWQIYECDAIKYEHKADGLTFVRFRLKDRWLEFDFKTGGEAYIIENGKTADTIKF